MSKQSIRVEFSWQNIQGSGHIHVVVNCDDLAKLAREHPQGMPPALRNIFNVVPYAFLVFYQQANGRYTNADVPDKNL